MARKVELYASRSADYVSTPEQAEQALQGLIAELWDRARIDGIENVLWNTLTISTEDYSVEDGTFLEPSVQSWKVWNARVDAVGHDVR